MANSEDVQRYMRAYYHTFKPTGEDGVDAVLEAIAIAGRRYHSTDLWDTTIDEDHENGLNHWDMIQRASDALAAEVRELRRDRARLEDLAGRRAVVLAFFRSVIHCREPWTDKCQLEYDAAMGGGEGEA